MLRCVQSKATHAGATRTPRGSASRAPASAAEDHSKRRRPEMAPLGVGRLRGTHTRNSVTVDSGMRELLTIFVGLTTTEPVAPINLPVPPAASGRGGGEGGVGTPSWATMPS